MRVAWAAVAAVFLTLGLTACAGRRAAVRDAAPSLPAPAASASPPPAAQAPASAEDPFTRDVSPLLARKCAPCHVPGGRMYDRLPFDDPETVRANTDGILRRLRSPEDREVLERWLAGQGRQ